MKYKKLMLVTFVLLAILTLGAVNAADASNSDALAVDDDGGDSVSTPINDADSLLGDGDDEELEPEDDEGSSISFIKDAYVNDTIIEVMVEEGSSGRIVVEDDAYTYLNKSVEDDDWDTYDSDEGNMFWYQIKSSMFNPQIGKGSYDLTVTHFDGDGGIVASEDGTVTLYEKNSFESNNITIEIQEVPVSMDTTLVSIRALSNATYLVEIRIDDELVFEKQLDEIEANDDDDENYLWHHISASDFEDVDAGEYQIAVKVYLDEDKEVVSEGDIILVDDEGPGEEENPIYIMSTSYLGDTFIIVYLGHDDLGYLVVSDMDNSVFLNKSLSDDWGDNKHDSEEGYDYRIDSTMFDPQLEAGDYEFTVSYFNENDDEVATDTKEVTLFEENVIEQDGVVIWISVIPMYVEFDTPIVSIKALKSATNDVNITLENEGVIYSFEKSLDEFSFTDYDEEDENYQWYYVVPSDFDDLGAGEYYLELIFNLADDNVIERNATIVLKEEENDPDPDDEDEFNFQVWFRYALTFGDDIVAIVIPEEGTVIVTVDGNEFVHPITEDDADEGNILWNTEDLNITEAGLYSISVKYVSPSDEVTDVCSGNVFVSDVTISNEFNVSDEDAVIVSIYVPDGSSDRYLLIKAMCEDDYGDRRDVGSFEASLSKLTSDAYFNVTAKDLNLNDEYEFYFIEVYVLESDETEDIWWAYMISDEEVNAVDYTKFRADIKRGINQLSGEPAVLLYCPEGSAGTNVTILVMTDDEDELLVLANSINTTVSVEDEGKWIGWTIADLEMSLGYYKIIIYLNNDTEPAFSDPLEVEKAIGIPENVYLETEDEDRITVADVIIPSEIEDGSIVIKINGTEAFNKELSAFTERPRNWNISELYWHHPRYNGEDHDELNAYVINTFNIGYELQEGVSDVEVILNITGMDPIVEQASVTMSKPNSASENGYTIEIYDVVEYYLRDNEVALIKITSPENAEYYVIITLADDDEYMWDSRDVFFYDDEEDEEYGFEGSVYAADLGLDAGDYDIIVSVYDDNGDLMVNNTATITLVYGEDGIMYVDDKHEIYYRDDWGFSIGFEAPAFSGNLTIIVDGKEYYMKHVTERDCDPDEVRIFVSARKMGLEIGHYDNVEVLYHGDNGVNGSCAWQDLEVLQDEPDIFISYSDWDAQLVDFFWNCDDLIFIRPNGDDVSSIRVIVTIADEVYLNATLDELGLLPMEDDDGEYYTIGFIHFNRTVNLGEYYDDVVAYYISDNYSKETSDGDDNPGHFNVVGIVDEVEISDMYSDVVVIRNHWFEGQIVLHVWNASNWDELDPISYVIDEEDDDFICFDLDALGFDLGEYRIEAYYVGIEGDEYYIFDGELWVVDKSQFYVKSGCDWLYTTEPVISVWCPENANGTITVADREGNVVAEHEITDDDKDTYVGFTLSDLGIDSPNWYELIVSVDDNIIDEFGLEVPHPIYVEDKSVYLPEEGYGVDQSMRLGGLELTSEASGYVVVIVDGTVVLNKTLDKLRLDKDGKKFIYSIYTSDFDVLVEEGMHAVTVTFNDMEMRQAPTFYKRNIKSEDNVAIEIFEGNTPNDYSKLAQVTVFGNDPEGLIIVTLKDGTEIFSSYTEYLEHEWFDDGCTFYIYADNLMLEPGVYDIVVTFEPGEESYSNEGTITLMGWYSDNVDMWVDVYDNDSIGMNNQWVQVRPYGVDGRVVIIADGKECFNATIDELNPVEGEDDHYYITPSNLTGIEFGTYNDIIITFYGNDYSRRSLVTQATFVFSTHVLAFLNPAAFDYDYNYTADRRIVDFHISEDANGILNITVDGVLVFSKELSEIHDGEYGEDPTDFYFIIYAGEFDMAPGEHHEIWASYVGYDGYVYEGIEYMDSYAGTFNYRAQPNFTINVTGTNQGNPIVINVTADKYFNGDVLVYVGEFNATVSLVDGNGIGGMILPAGNDYVALINFEENDLYFDETAQSNPFNVTSKLNSPIEIIIEKDTYTAFENFTIAVTNVTAVNVTINDKPCSIVNGKVVIDTTALEADNYTVVVSNVENEEYVANSTTAKFTIVKKDSSIIINVDSIHKVGEEFTIGITNSSAATVTINDDPYDIADGKVVVDTTKLAAGNYTVVASIAGDGQVEANSTTAKFTVAKWESPISINIEKEVYVATDDFAIAVANVTAVNVTINGKPYAVKADGTVDIDTTALTADQYTVVVSNAENDKYLANETSASFTIIKKDANVSIVVGTSYNFGDDFAIVIINNSAVNVTINDKAYAVADGKVVVDTTALSAGNYTVVASIAGDDQIEGDSTTAKFIIKPVASTLEVSSDTITFESGKSGNVTVTFTGAEDIKYNLLYVLGSNVTRDGNVITVNGLSEGNYTLSISTTPDSNHTSVTKEVKVVVTKVIVPVDNTTIPLDNENTTNTKTPTFSINLPEDATGTFTVTINGKNYTQTLSKGKATVVVDDITVAGNYEVTLVYSGDTKYAPIVKKTNSTVTVDPEVVAAQASVLYTGNYYVKVYGKDGNIAVGESVAFYINGKYVKTVRTNKYGNAMLGMHYKYLPNKKYTIKAVSLGKSAQKVVSVKQILTLKSAKIRKSAKLVLTATLKKVDGKYLKGKKIIFKLNGKKIKTVKTNSKGVAKATIKKSLVQKYLKKYKVGKKVSYSATYYKTTVKKTTKVKK